MNSLISTAEVKTMSSREIAELTGKRHDNVLRDIDFIHSNLSESSKSVSYKGYNNQSQREWLLTKRDTLLVVSGYSVELRARIIDRWQELEEQVRKAALPDFANPAEAARAWANEYEQKVKLEQQLTLAAPKVEFADRVGEASGILIGNFAKVVGIGPNKLFAWMRDHKILIASGSRRNVPMQEYMDRGYFTVRETAVNTNHGIQISFTTKITGRGQQWLTRKLLDNGMLKVTGEAA